MDGLKEKMYPVMLPTQKATGICTDSRSESHPKLLNYHTPNWSDGTKEGYTKNFHVYICSNAVIKKGDFAIKGNVLFQHFAKNNYDNAGAKKVIASTDKSLGLPEPSKEFIEVYIKAYNSGTPITEVMVDMEEALAWTTENNKVWPNATFRAKVDKNNTITITKVVETWDNLYNKFKNYLKQAEREKSPTIVRNFHQWLKKENYLPPTKIK